MHLIILICSIFLLLNNCSPEERIQKDFEKFAYNTVKDMRDKTGIFAVLKTLKYEVKKTDSLTYPYKGIVTYEQYPENGLNTTTVRVMFGYKDRKWHYIQNNNGIVLFSN